MHIPRWLFLVIILGSIAFFAVGFFARAGMQQFFPSFFLKNQNLISPVIFKEEKNLPLLQYSIPALAQRKYTPSTITVERVLADKPEYTSYLFSFQTLNKKMTGMLNVPKLTVPIDGKFPVILLIRGYVPPEMCKTGVGTQHAGEFFAQHGYVTFAPDFFSCGESDSETTDNWEARFQKPISVIELLKSIQNNHGITLLDAKNNKMNQLLVTNPQKIGIWAHSNGGQIALTTLEILQAPIPTTLWAPVTAPFPYSILYFSDEASDEGKAIREDVNNFEKDYNVFDFSLTQHLDLLKGPLQIQQGLNDDAIHYTWSQEFVDKVKKAQIPPIAITLYTYPGADHNMKGSWDQAIQRDLLFFQKNVSETP